MKVARYVGGGKIAIVDEQSPDKPRGGLLVQTLASGLCSGELMDWYMDRKIPHVLGHEVSGRVLESDREEFPVGSLVFPHHHAPCMDCDLCAQGLHVHCRQWKATHLKPGGMAEQFAVAPGNLNDTHRVDDLRPRDAALVEPLACVMKSVTLVGDTGGRRAAVIGLGVMGLMHMLALPAGAVGYELLPERRAWAQRLGLDARAPSESEGADVVFVCPGTRRALEFALEIARPGASIVLFAPMPPGEKIPLALDEIYFKDLKLLNSYSCGPNDTAAALELLRAGKVRAEQVVSHFIGIDELPEAYGAMKRGEILKPMVIFE